MSVIASEEGFGGIDVYATEFRLDARSHISVCIRAGYGRKPCFLFLKHLASSMRPMSTFGLLAAFQTGAFNLPRAPVCLEDGFCFARSSLLLLGLWAKIKHVLVIGFPLVPLLFPTEHVIYSL